MSSLLINGVVNAFEGEKYPNQILRAAIPCSKAGLDRVKKIRDGINRRTPTFIPRDVRADLFASDTMSSWFRMTGVGLIPEDNQDKTTTRAIEESCKKKLLEYGVQIPIEKTARAALMDYIFKEAIKASTVLQKMKIIAAMNQCSDIPYIQSFSSLFYSWVITALKVVKQVSRSRLLHMLVALFVFYRCANRRHSWIMYPILNTKTWPILRPIIWIAYLFVGYIGLGVAFWFIFFTIRSVISIEHLTNSMHKTAEIAHQNNELNRAYITWMKQTAGGK